jgi:uncharacterized membrane protein YdjX (TVP38/TMEM64 family)
LEKIGPRLAAGLMVVVGAVLAVHFVYRGGFDPVAIRNFVAGNEFAPGVFILLQVLASLLFVPRTPLGIAAGLVFGFGWGSFWAIAGAVAGAAAGFALWRWIGAGEIDLDATPRLGPLIQRAERGGWRSVAIVRLIPGLPHSVANTGLALTRVGWRDYLLGSFLGMLPMTLVQVDIGAAGGQVLQGHSGWMLGSLLLAVGLGASFLIKRAAKRQV